MTSNEPRTSNRAGYLILSLADMLFICIFLALVLVPDRGMLNDGDTGYHIRAGEYILQHLSLPRLDPWSFHTPTLPWTVHEWLSEVIMALAHQAGGLAGVVAFYSALLALTYYLFARMLRAQGISPLAAAAASLIVIAPSTVHWLARPHVFSLLIIVLWCWILDAFEERGVQRLYLLPPLMLLWVNLHGGYIIGFVILGIYLVGSLLSVITGREEGRKVWGDKARCSAVAFAGSMVAALVNPFGWKIFLFPFKLVFDKYQMDHTNEFMAPNFHEYTTFKLMLLAMVLILAVSRRRPTFVQIVLTLLFTNMALYSVRYIPLFALVVVPIILHHTEWSEAGYFGKIVTFLRRRADIVAAIDGRARGFFWPAAASVIVIVLILNGTIVHGFDPKRKPLDALNFLKREHIPGRMFNNDEFGDLIIYSAAGQYKVYIDGRLDMYGSERLKEYFKITGFAAGWDEILRRHDISWIFIETKSELARFLLCRQDWRLIYSDKVASIYVQNIPMYADLIARYPGVRLVKVENGEKK